jgi:Na+/melibiose symporter-like transporter
MNQLSNVRITTIGVSDVSYAYCCWLNVRERERERKRESSDLRLIAQLMMDSPK